MQPRQQQGLSRRAGAGTEAVGGLVGGGDQAVGQGGTGVADAGGVGGDGDGGDAAEVEGGETAEAGVVDADAGVIEGGGKAGHAQGHGGVAADQAAVRAGDDDGVYVVGEDHGCGVDEDEAADRGFGAFDSAAFGELGWDCVGRGGGLEAGGGVGAAHSFGDPGLGGGGVDAADAAAGHHVVGVADTGGLVGDRGSGDAEVLQERKGADAGVVAADAGVVEDGGADACEGGETAGVDAAVRAGDEDGGAGVFREFRRRGCADDGHDAGRMDAVSGDVVATRASDNQGNAVPAHNVDIARLREHHRLMWRIRALEEAALRGLDEKLVLGAIHPSIGQEAVAAGVVGSLARTDVLLSTHRGHGHTLAKGASSEAMLRELFGRVGGTCGGKGGSMHIADFAVGMLGANGVVGANIVIAAGAAHAIKLKREARIVCCIFGDGAINRGPFLEGLNWASVFGLPVLFVCEDNGFAATTRTASMTAGPGPAARARSFGLVAEEVDGNDVLAVEAAAVSAIAAVRTGGGPRFLHARTYRLTGHTGADAAAYRPAEVLREAGVSDVALAADRAAAEAEMRAAYDTARGAAYPGAEQAFVDVQDVGAPVWERV